MPLMMAPNPRTQKPFGDIYFRSCYCPLAIVRRPGCADVLQVDQFDFFYSMTATIYWQIFVFSLRRHDYATWVYMHTFTGRQASGDEDKTRAGRAGVALLNHSSFSTHVRSRFVRPKYNDWAPPSSSPSLANISNTSRVSALSVLSFGMGTSDWARWIDRSLPRNLIRRCGAQLLYIISFWGDRNAPSSCRYCNQLVVVGMEDVSNMGIKLGKKSRDRGKINWMCTCRWCFCNCEGTWDDS